MSGILVVAATHAELGGEDGLVCGVGPVEAAASVAQAIERSRPRAILHVGIAGARANAGLEPLEVVVGEAAVYEDLQTVRRLAPDVVLADTRLVQAICRAIPEARLARIGTTGSVGGAAKCPVEAMEGFAVLRAAELAGVPAVEVRTISNLVEDDRSSWRMPEAIAVIRELLPRLRETVSRLDL